MIERAAALRSLVAGDVIYASADGFDGVVIGLVTAVDRASIQARSVTTHQSYRFDIITGIETESSNWTCFVIRSVERLPNDAHRVVLGLDAKFHPSRPPDSLQLTDIEKSTLLLLADFYAEHPLPAA